MGVSTLCQLEDFVCQIYNKDSRGIYALDIRKTHTHFDDQDFEEDCYVKLFHMGRLLEVYAEEYEVLNELSHTISLNSHAFAQFARSRQSFLGEFHHRWWFHDVSYPMIWLFRASLFFLCSSSHCDDYPLVI